ncbi:MAG: histidine--tRNA ligase [Thermodesulfobacteriota bacterium]|nr:histidine--tRNA ligase [Thermodesulfobacteriota bacterium]
MAKITSVRGFKDILPEEAGKWQYVERTAREIFSCFGVQEIRIPVLEKTDLFKRGIGEATDIVEKEMYTFLDRGNEYLTLRPEATASVIRAYIEHHIYETMPSAKLFTIGPMFRRERPQRGRFRQFHQINVEFIGQEDPRTDAELIFMLIHFLKAVGIDNLNLEINSLGCAKCRPQFRKEVTDFLMGSENSLCPDCKRRLTTNPLRVFDCKVESCKDILSSAPVILNYLCAECNKHFEDVKELLKGLGIAFDVNTRMVRGLDYYTRTAFEITTASRGSQNAVTGGGRYDGLVKLLGGPDIPGVGFAIGFERLISMIPKKEEAFQEHPHIFIAALGDKAQEFSFLLCNSLRKTGIRAEMDFSGKNLKSQMKRSDKLNCNYTLIIGERELEENSAQLRNMETKSQESIAIDSTDSAVNAIKNLDFRD